MIHVFWIKECNGGSYTDVTFCMRIAYYKTDAFWIKKCNGAILI